MPAEELQYDGEIWRWISILHPSGKEIGVAMQLLVD